MISENESIEIIDKTVEDAIERGIEQLGVKKENVNVEVVNEAGSNLWGLLGKKQARVQISIKQGYKEYMENFMENLLRKMGVNGIVSAQQSNGDLYINVNGENLGVLIGRRGQTLNSLQYLINVVMRRQFENFEGRVILDVENYRQEKETTLKQLALNMADKVETQKQEITLEPMIPQERRIIHLALKDNPHIITYSSGEEPYRKVVIAPGE